MALGHAHVQESPAARGEQLRADTAARRASLCEKYNCESESSAPVPPATSTQHHEYLHDFTNKQRAPPPRCAPTPHCFFLSASRFASALSSAMAYQTKLNRRTLAMTAAVMPAPVVFFSIGGHGVSGAARLTRLAREPPK